MFNPKDRRVHSDHNCSVCLEREARRARADSELIIPSSVSTLSDRDLLFLLDGESVSFEVEAEIILRDLRYNLTQGEAN